jgi:BTB/POZ domain
MKMFTSSFQESKSTEGSINDISQEAFHEFLRYIYTETIENIDLYVLELLAISDLYEVEDLKAICKAQLQTSLTEENAPFVFQYAHRYRCDDDLKEASFKLIKGQVANEFHFILYFNLSKCSSNILLGSFYETISSCRMSFSMHQKLCKMQSTSRAKCSTH